ncbi:Uncharacterised protein [Streptococcus sanguinis]|uniref:Uncharacterized protein n=1 Tax=Streptococcus sanguinis TaxID=1305 RepID=A0AAJ5NNH5_STRSA|nr:asparagine synthase [Streptococcus sanguinis]VDY72874.1 Uncharacterised protein [Streptococcus sanguinis]
MTKYTIRYHFKKENSYSVWNDTGELIEDNLSYGEALYWSFRELAKYVQLGYLAQNEADSMRGDIEAYNNFINKLAG